MDLPHPPPVNVNHCCSCVNVVKTSHCQGLRHKEATPQQLLEIPVLPAADGNERKYFLAHWSSLLYQIESLWVFPQWLQCPPGSGLLVSPPSMFSRVKRYWLLGWASFPPSPGGPSSLRCICLSQGVDVLLMQIHGTVAWINDPTSNSTHPWTLPRLWYERYPQSFRSSPPFIYFLLCSSSSSLSSLCGLAYSPILRTCSWNAFNSALTALRVFSSPLLFDSSVSGLFTVSNSKTPSCSRSSSCGSFYNWACCSPLAVFTSENGLLPAPFRPPRPLDRVVFLWGRPRLSPYLSRGWLLPLSYCALCGALTAFWVGFPLPFSLLSLKSITLDSWD